MGLRARESEPGGSPQGIAEERDDVVAADLEVDLVEAPALRSQKGQASADREMRKDGAPCCRVAALASLSVWSIRDSKAVTGGVMMFMPPGVCGVRLGWSTA